jgi:hypothetical protein
MRRRTRVLRHHRDGGGRRPKSPRRRRRRARAVRIDAMRRYGWPKWLGGYGRIWCFDKITLT